MDRKLVIIGLLGVFIVAPLVAWGSVEVYKSLTLSSSTTQAERTKEDLYETIRRSNTEVYGADVPRPELEIALFKRVEKQWYLVSVKQKNSNGRVEKMLIGDFYPQADRMVVITEPGQGLTEFNISGIGVPYSVIDELNSEAGEI